MRVEGDIKLEPQGQTDARANREEDICFGTCIRPTIRIAGLWRECCRESWSGDQQRVIDGDRALDPSGGKGGAHGLHGEVFKVEEGA